MRNIVCRKRIIRRKRRALRLKKCLLNAKCRARFIGGLKCWKNKKCRARLIAHRKCLRNSKCRAAKQVRARILRLRKSLAKTPGFKPLIKRALSVTYLKCKRHQHCRRRYHALLHCVRGNKCRSHFLGHLYRCAGVKTCSNLMRKHFTRLTHCMFKRKCR